jgi:hypothetical protein
LAYLGISFDPDAARLQCVDELRTYDQWVGWKKEPDPPRSKPKKVPINPRSQFEKWASSTDPKTWGTYDGAVACVARLRLAGVGFVLTDEDDFIGIDLDACRDVETGEISPWAQTILAFGETYAEVSPSGTGIRMIARGDPMPAAKSNAAGVEVYFDKRYLTITQAHIEGSPLYINPAPRTLAALLARVEEFKKPQDAPAERHPTTDPASKSAPAVLADDFFTSVKQMALRNLAAWVPAIFPRARPQSGTGAYRISSKALGRDLEEDLSIAPNGIVDFGVHDMGDPREGKRTAIDIVMEYGGAPDALAAAKWLCERMGVDPESLGALPDRAEWDGEFRNPQPRATIVEDGVVADAETGEVIEDAPPAPAANGLRFKLTRFDEIPYSIDDDDLVEGLLPSTGVAVIWGAPKSGKSFWALDLSMHIALGWKYRELNVECGVVVYVALEGQAGFRRRIEGFCREKLDGKRDHDALFYLIETPLKLVKDQKKLVSDIRSQLGDLQPTAIFFDTFFRAFEGSEIDASDMEKNLAACDAIKRAFGCLVTLIHHSGWDGERMRGHSSLFGGVDAVISVKKDGQNVVAKLEDAKDIASGAEIASRLIEVEIGTNKYGKPVTTLTIADAADPVEIKIDEEAEGKELTTDQEVLRALLNKPGGNLREWAEMAETSKDSVSRALERLKKHKLVEKPFAKWRLTPLGKREATQINEEKNG